MTMQISTEIRHNQIIEADGQAFDGWMVFIRDEKNTLLDVLEGTYSDEPQHAIADWKKEYC